MHKSLANRPLESARSERDYFIWQQFVEQKECFGIITDSSKRSYSLPARLCTLASLERRWDVGPERSGCFTSDRRLNLRTSPTGAGRWQELHLDWNGLPGLSLSFLFQQHDQLIGGPAIEWSADFFQPDSWWSGEADVDGSRRRYAARVRGHSFLANKHVNPSIPMCGYFVVKRPAVCIMALEHLGACPGFVCQCLCVCARLFSLFFVHFFLNFSWLLTASLVSTGGSSGTVFHSSFFRHLFFIFFLFGFRAKLWVENAVAPLGCRCI